MVQKVKNSMGLVNIPNELLEQVSKDGMSMLFGGENFGGVDLNESLNNGLHCNVTKVSQVKIHKRDLT